MPKSVEPWHLAVHGAGPPEGQSGADLRYWHARNSNAEGNHSGHTICTHQCCSTVNVHLGTFGRMVCSSPRVANFVRVRVGPKSNPPKSFLWPTAATRRFHCHWRRWHSSAQCRWAKKSNTIFPPSIRVNNQPN